MSVTQSERVLDIAARELHGTISRTNTSVIGRRGNETIIFATNQRGWTVTAMMAGIRFSFAIEPRGLFRKSLHVEGTPIDVVNEVLDEAHLRLLEAFQPQLVQLMPNGLRIEQKHGVAQEEIGKAMDIAAALAARVRFAQQMMISEPRRGLQSS